MRASFLLFFALICSAEETLPPSPHTYLQDETGTIPAESRQKVETLLSEHDRATGDQIVFTVFRSLGDRDLVDWTNKIFQHWAIGKRGQDTGVLLALYMEERKIRIEVGYGLEDRITDAKSKEIIEDDLRPSLKEGDPGVALEKAAVSILRLLESPLVTNGRVEAIYGEKISRIQEPSGNRKGLPIAQIFLLIMVVLSILRARARDTLFGSFGSRSRRRGFMWGGGGFGGGGFGGGGGFSGGGGRSGGGGASGGW